MAPTAQTAQVTPDTGPRTATARTALVGWSAEAMDGLQKAERSFIAVVPPEFGPYMEEHDLPYEPWDFDRLDEKAGDLATSLKERGVEFAVPLYEETVEWAGAINARLRGDPRLFNRSLLFRDKAMMKRMAQIAGLRVGVFEEVQSREEVSRFLHRVNDALLKLEAEDPDPVHIKPKGAAGTIGHRIIRSDADIHDIPDDDFPLLAESHLAGQEFSVEAFVHDGTIQFLNITEYVHLGHCDFVPAGPELEAHREDVEKAVERLIEAFRFDHGVLHPEFFLGADGELRFGEVASRVPGGHIFQSIQDAYGFDPFVGYVLCADPDTPQEELDAFFPTPVEAADGHAGVLMVYPKPGTINELRIPDEVLDDPYFRRHTLVDPIPGKVSAREGFGNHFGTLFFQGDDPDRLRERLLRYEELDYYV